MAKPSTKTSKTRWSLQDAKNRFSEVVNAALTEGPQVVTRRGVETAVVVAHEDYERLVSAPTEHLPFTHFLLAGTLSPASEPFERIKLRSRGDV